MLWRYLCYTITLLVGATMLFGGALVLHFLPQIFSNKIKLQLPIVKGTDAYNRYTQSSVPLYVKMYMFNVTNPREVVQDNAKPILQQVGPFSLSERRRKQVTSISPDNKTLDYKLYRVYYFNEAESIPLDSIITLPNAPAFSAAYSAQRRNEEGDSAADALEVLRDNTKDETVYITHTAREWLFDGVKMKFLDKLNEEGVFNDDQPPDNKFGFYYKKNDTWDDKADGVMTISTGVDGDFDNIGRVLKWNGKSDLSFWKGKTCNTLKGTDGQFFHPNVQKDDKLDIFAPDLCRTLQIEYNRTTSIRSIELYRFVIASSFFKPMNHQEETKCYCVKRSHEKQKFCKLSGLIDVSTCRNKPIVLSTPHFLGADQILRDPFEGLAPNASEHDTYIDIEPMSGAVLRVRRRLQVNVEMFPSKGFENSEVLKTKMIQPFIWLDQRVDIPDELAQKLESKLTKKFRWFSILCLISVIVGPIILLGLLVLICQQTPKKNKKLMRKSSAGEYQSRAYPGGDYHLEERETLSNSKKLLENTN